MKAACIAIVLFAASLAHAAMPWCNSATLLEQQAPIYPPIARAANVQGTVLARLTVMADGSIQDVDVISGPEMLRPTVIQAVKKWKLQEALANGESCMTVAAVRFQISDDVPSTPKASSSSNNATNILSMEITAYRIVNSCRGPLIRRKRIFGIF